MNPVLLRLLLLGLLGVNFSHYATDVFASKENYELISKLHNNLFHNCYNVLFYWCVIKAV